MDPINHPHMVGFLLGFPHWINCPIYRVVPEKKRLLKQRWAPAPSTENPRARSILCGVKPWKWLVSTSEWRPVFVVESYICFGWVNLVKRNDGFCLDQGIEQTIGHRANASWDKIDDEQKCFKMLNQHQWCKSTRTWWFTSISRDVCIYIYNHQRKGNHLRIQIPSSNLT